MREETQERNAGEKRSMNITVLSKKTQNVLVTNIFIPYKDLTNPAT